MADSSTSYHRAALAALLALSVFTVSDVRSQVLSQKNYGSHCLLEPSDCRTAQYALIGFSSGLLVGGTVLTYHAVRLDPDNGHVGGTVKAAGILGGISITGLGALGVVGGIVRLRRLNGITSRLSMLPVVSGNEVGMHVNFQLHQ